MKHIIWIAASASLLLSACNTIQGMGEDVSAGGRAIADTAHKAKSDISNSSGR